MIRGTKNEGISSVSKQRHGVLQLQTTGVKGESYETVAILSGVAEVRDAFDDHTQGRTTFPSSAFNGVFE